jgi:PAS domain S-box-containing protein
MAQLISGKVTTSSFEKRYLRKNGSVFWAAVSTSLVKSKGLPDHFITQIIDISEQRQAEDMLFARARKPPR